MSFRQACVSRKKYIAQAGRSNHLEGGFIGNVLAIKMKSMNPDYPQIAYLLQDTEDKIYQRLRKSIAVFDFSSPASNPDAGVILAQNLITFLFKTASGDIKILERENLKSILEELKQGQGHSGAVLTHFTREIGHAYDLDVAVTGSVLLFKVDASSTPGIKTVRYQVGTKIEDNIEYLNWAAKHPEPTKQEREEAPPAKLLVPAYAEKDYQVSHHKKIAFIQISFRVIEATTGEDIQVKTIERKLAVEDEGRAGVPEANIEFDPVEIPSDTELLQRITEEIVTELGQEVLRPLQNLERAYFQEGEKYMGQQDTIKAAENMVNALFDERLKGIQGSPLTEKALQNLNKVFLDYQLRRED